MNPRLLVLVALVGTALVLPAQDPPVEGASGAASRDSFIPLSRIAAEAGVVEERLLAIADAAKVARPIPQVDREVTDVTSRIDRRHAQLEGKLSRRTDANDLETETRVWNGFKGRLADQQDELAKWTGRLDQWTREVDDLHARWQTTFEHHQRAPGELDEAIRASITTTTDALKRRTEALGAWSQEAVALELRIRQQRTRLNDALERVETALGDARSRLLQRDLQPWWQGWSTDQGFRGELDRTRQSILQTRDNGLEYLTTHREQVFLHILCFLLFAWICHYSRQRLRTRGPSGDEKTDARTAELLRPLQRSLSAAFLLSLCLTPFIHAEATRRLQFLVVLPLVPAWLRVVVALVPAPVRGGLVALTLLVLIGITRAYIDASEVLDRLLLIGELALAVAALAWLRVRRALDRAFEGTSHPKWLAALKRWQRISLAASILGLGAALLAYTNLADVAARLVIAGIFLGTLLHAAVWILSGVIEGLLDAPFVNRLHMVRSQKVAISRLLRRCLRIASILGWVYLLMMSVTMWGLFRDNAARVLSAEIGYGSVAFSLGSLLAFGLTLWISWMIARTLSFVLNEEVFARTRLPAGVPETISSFSRYAILVMGFLIAMAMVGISLDRLALLVSALGVGIGFGLQNITNNFVSGLILLFERPIRVGDQVQLDEVMGRVVKIGIRASVVLTRDGSEVLVPNGDFISGRVINWTLKDRKRRITLPIGVAYGTDPERVLKILMEVASGHPESLNYPAPEALFIGFGESSLDFEMRAWTDSLRDWRLIRSELAVTMNQALADAGIEIPFPQRDLHVRSMEPDVRRSLEGPPGGS